MGVCVLYFGKKIMYRGASVSYLLGALRCFPSFSFLKDNCSFFSKQCINLPACYLRKGKQVNIYMNYIQKTISQKLEGRQGDCFIFLMYGVWR